MIAAIGRLLPVEHNETPPYPSSPQQILSNRFRLQSQALSMRFKADNHGGTVTWHLIHVREPHILENRTLFKYAQMSGRNALGWPRSKSGHAETDILSFTFRFIYKGSGER